MAKRRQGNRDEVMLIPFLNILSSLIGVLILIIVVLCVAQSQQTNGRSPEEESLSRKLYELMRLRKPAEEEENNLKVKLAQLESLQADLSAKRNRMTELRKRLDMSGEEAKANKDQAAKLQKQVESLVLQIEALVRQMPPLRNEIEELKKALALRNKKPDDKPLPVVIRPSGSGYGGNKKLFFVETSNGAVTIRKGRAEKVNVGQGSLVTDGNFNSFLQQVKNTPNSMLIFLMRQDGWVSYFVAAGYAESKYGLVTGKLPIPGPAKWT